MAVSERLALLRRLRGDLADELTALGVPSRQDETLEVLVPRVLQCLEGAGEGFAASLKPAWDVSYGCFSAGETVSLAGMAAIARAVRVTALTVTVTGKGVSALSAAGTGWTVSRSGDALTAQYRPGGVLLPAALAAALERLTLAGDGATPVTATVALRGLGFSGGTYPADGTASFSYVYHMTWELLGLVCPTWTELSGRTWRGVERFSKP